jgi:hypothetical protein
MVGRIQIQPRRVTTAFRAMIATTRSLTNAPLGLVLDISDPRGERFSCPCFGEERSELAERSATGELAWRRLRAV